MARKKKGKAAVADGGKEVEVEEEGTDSPATPRANSETPAESPVVATPLSRSSAAWTPASGAVDSPSKAFWKHDAMIVDLAEDPNAASEDGLRGDLHAAEHTLATLKSERDAALEAQSKEHTQTVESIQRLTQELAEMTKRAEAAEARATTAEAKVQELEQANATLQSEKTAAEQQSEALKQERDAQTTSLASAQTELAARASRVAELEAALTAKDEELRTALSSSQAASGARSDLDERLREAQAEVTRISGERDAAVRDAASKVEKAVNDLLASQQEREQEAMAAQKTIQQIQQSRTDAEQALAAARKQVDEYKVYCKSLKDEIVGMKEEVETAEELIGVQKQSLDKTRQLMAAYKAEREKYKIANNIA